MLLQLLIVLEKNTPLISGELMESQYQEAAGCMKKHIRKERFASFLTHDQVPLNRHILLNSHQYRNKLPTHNLLHSSH